MATILHREKSCGAVLYTERDGKRLFLLIKNRGGHIGFPKGHVQDNETEHETATREIMEETGVSAIFETPFRETSTYMSARDTEKEVVYFLARYEWTKVTIPPDEILAFYLLPYKNAMKLLSFPREKEILKQANVTVGFNRTVTICPPTKEDLEDLSAYLRDPVIHNYTDDPNLPDTIRMVRCKDKPAGWFHLRKENNGKVRIKTLFIRQSYRKQGLGHYILAKIEQAVQEAEQSGLYIRIAAENTNMIHFYSKKGYFTQEDPHNSKEKRLTKTF